MSVCTRSEIPLITKWIYFREDALVKKEEDFNSLLEIYKASLIILDCI